MNETLHILNAGEYIKDLTAAVVGTYKGEAERVSINMDVEDLELSIDTAIPAGLVLNELISNSLKHAFPDSRPGHITISLHTRDSKLNLRYSDDGVGPPAGFDVAKSGSLGLSLIYNIVYKQLNGSLETRTGRGTEFEITFKIK